MSIILKLSFLIVVCILQINFIKAQNYGACTTPNRERATCVELEQCEELNALLHNPNITPNDRSYLSRSQCGYVNKKVLVCCPNRIRVTAAPAISSPTITSPSATLPQFPECGSVLTSKIYGGNVTRIDEFPWMALIEYTKPGNVKGHHCGGTLISNRYVLTAAHCVVGRAIPTDWRLTGVRLGEWDTTTNPDCETDARGIPECVPEHLDISVEEQTAHPQYNPNARSQYNDIALLRLARTVATTKHVQPICLPSSANLRNQVLSGTTMDVAGWGKTENEASSNLKLKAEVSVWDLARCRTTYTRQNINLETTQLCAGGERGVDSCRGDSGGPLMVEQKVSGRNVFFLMGVVSFGPTPCGLSGWPGVYTRVGSYIDWIQNNIK